MSNKKKKLLKNRQQKKTVLTPEESAARTKRIIIIAVCIAVGIAMLLGLVLGIIAAVRNASYVMKLDRVGIDEGVARFLISIYKTDYMSNAGITTDTDEFWSSKYYTGTMGDLFNYEATEYLKTVITANALFDKYATLTKDDKYKIEYAVQEILHREASGSKKEFNELTEKWGFDYKDFRKGSEMIYKLRTVYSAIFGADASRVQTDFADYCESFYNQNYIRAKILVIRTADTFKVDDKGELVKGEDGTYETVPLTKEQLAERVEYINRLDEYVKRIKENPNGEADLKNFNNLLDEAAEKYSNENVVSGVKNGYYLAENSQYASDMGLPDVIKAALSLDIGEIYTYETGSVVDEDSDTKESFSYKCYVYRMEKEKGAYKNTSLEHYFRDFNTLAAVSLYSDMVDDYSKEIDFKKKWDKLNPASVPYNSTYKVNKFPTSVD